MLNVDVEPLNSKLLNNMSAHSDYLKHTQEEAVILRKIVEQGKSQNPLNAYLDSACYPNCSLVFGLWLLHAMTGNRSQFTNFVNKILGTVKFGNDHMTKILGSGPTLHEMTSATISLRLVPNTPPSTPFVPPSRSDWDILFQPLFDELLTPPPSVDYLAPKVIALIAEVDHPLENIIDQLARPVSIRLQLHEQARFCYYDAFLTSVKPKTYKDALTQSCWIEAMQEELNEFERLGVWKLVPRPDKVIVITLKWIYKVKLDELGGLQISQSPRGIFINRSKYALEFLKKYGFDSYDPVDTPMVEKSKLDKDKEGKAVDPSHDHGMIGTLLYLTASRPYLQFPICICARYQARPNEEHLHAVKKIF
nr:retrovirus-related Pol polyprotein from transposon TNT 1-94 [Tanacetum cinerariifolium]